MEKLTKKGEGQMKLEEAIKFVKRIGIGNGALKALGCEIIAKPTGRAGGLEIVIYFDKVPDRDDGKMGERPNVFQHHAFIPEVELSKLRILDKIRSGLRSAMGHEIDEGILLDGKRPFDPHAGEDLIFRLLA